MVSGVIRIMVLTLVLLEGTFAYHYDHDVDLRIRGRTIEGWAIARPEGWVLETFRPGAGE